MAGAVLAVDHIEREGDLRPDLTAAIGSAMPEKGEDGIEHLEQQLRA